MKSYIPVLTKTKIRTATLITIAVTVAVIATAAALSVGNGKAYVKISVDSLSSMDKTIVSGGGDELLARFSIFANSIGGKKVRNDKLVIKKVQVNATVKNTQNKSKFFSKMGKLLIAKCNEKNSSGNVAIKTLKKSKISSNGKAVFKNLSNIPVEKESFFCIFGKFKKDIPSGKVIFKIKSKPTLRLKSLNFRIRSGYITIKGTWPKIKVIKSNQSPSVSITSPVANASWVKGSVQTIRWTTSNYPIDAKVSLFLVKSTVVDGIAMDDPIKVIASNIDNSGRVNWLVPSSITPSSEYFIQIDCHSKNIEGCKNNKSNVFSIY